MSQSNRLTTRLDRLNDKREADREKLVDTAIKVRKPMFNTTGINDFDDIVDTAKGLFEIELRQKIEANPNIDVDELANKIFIKHRQLNQDHFETVSQALLDRYGYKTVKEVKEAYERGEVIRLESDKMIWFLEHQPSTKPSTPTKSVIK